MNCFCITNVEISQDFIINEYIQLKKSHEYDGGTIVIVNNQPNIFESNDFIFYRTLQLAIPKVNLQVQSTLDTDNSHNIELMKKLNSYLINYYVNDDNGGIHLHTEKIKLIKDDFKKINEMHKLVIDYSKDSGTKRNPKTWKPTRWVYAYNQYTQACSTLVLETSFLHLISGLEALLVEGNGELSHRVSLYASIITRDTKDERVEVYRLLKKVYNIRSKAVHGDVSALFKEFKKNNIYELYFRVKEVLATILVKLYKMEGSQVFDKIEDAIFQCPSF